MTVEQFLDKLPEKREFINRVSIMFFAADLAETLAIELEAMMQPHACLNCNIKQHVKEIKKRANLLIKHSDKTLADGSRLEDFANDGDYFKSLAYGWAGLGSYSKPFKLGALLEALDKKANGNKMRVFTYNDIVELIKELEA